MNKLAWFVGVVAVATGVGCDDNRNVAVSNTNPLGTVGGRVLDVNGETPLAGAAVTLEEAGTTVMMTMTDAMGAYSFAKVPAGSFFLTIAAGGYEGAYVPGVLSGSVGNFPVSNPQTTMPTVEMFKTDTTFAVAIVDDRGAPVSGVALTARPQVKYFAYNYPYSGGMGFPVLLPFGQYTVSATTDANGVATFMGLPNAVALNMIGNTTQMFVDVPPVQVMGSTTYQFTGATYDVNPTHVQAPAGQNVYTVQLTGPNSALTVVSSTVTSLGPSGTFTATGAVVPVGQPLSVTFNRAVDQQSLRAQLLDENGVSLGNMTPTFNAGNIVSLAPASPFGVGKRYNLLLSATPAGGSMGSYSATGPFFTAGPAALTVTAALVASPMSPMPTAGKVVQLTFSEAVGLGRGTGAVALTCVAWYEGIDLDNSGGTVSYQGEYGTPLQTCPNAVNPPIGGLDVTRIVSMEPTTGMPLTGFANKWWVQLDDVTVTPSTTTTGCKNTVAAACTKPASGTMMHLIFSHLPATQTVTRADGTVVGDLMVAIQ